jgi:putative ABC transport system permease protein
MKKTALLKSSIREIKQSPARFFSILGIIFLGVAFFVGIGATGPDMIQSADDYYKKQQLSDITVYSSLGFSEEDQTYLEKQKNLESVVPQYVLDMHLVEKNEVVRFYSLTDTMNVPVLESGKLPKENEIILDTRAKGYYKLGDTFEVQKSDDSENNLKQQQYKIVGFATTPEFIDNAKRGNTNVGNGAIDYFALLPEEAFQMDAYSRMLLSFKNVQTVTAYSDEYTKLMGKNQEQLEDWLEPRKQARLTEIKEAANRELEKNRQKIQEGEEQLEKAEQELKQAKEKLDQGQTQLEAAQQTYDEKIAAAKAEIQTREQQITEAEKELAANEQILNESQREVDRQSGSLDAYEAQLSQLEAQRTQLEEALNQLQIAQQTFKDIDHLTSQVDEVPEEELDQLLDDLRVSLQLLLTQLPEDNEWLTTVQQILDELSSESLLMLVADIRSLGGMIDSQIATLEENLAQLGAGVDEIAQGQQQLKEGQRQLDEGKQQIEEAKKQLADGKQQLAEGKQTLVVEEERGANQLESAEKEWQVGKKQYDEGLAEFTKQKEKELPKLKEATETLASEQKKIDELKPATFTLIDRESNPGYAEYKENANRISSIATVFPTIFFLIAALVSLTTMGRMIEEKRVEIGTLKALGYKNGEISQKFLLYSLSAGLLGSLLGLAVGFYLFPTIIISAYGQLYNIKEFMTPWYVGYSSIGIVVALVCTVGISLVALRVDLFSSPATLLRPKAPKAGKRILLEYLTPLWKRMSFIQKVTMRNLFRYKSRMFMTIFGIAGCTAMILTGFGLRDSISDVVPIQFSKIWHYQGIVTFKEQPTEVAYQKYLDELEQFDDYQTHLAIGSETLTMEKTGITSQDVTVYVPEKLEALSDFVLFNNRQTGKESYLTDDGAIINEKLATLFDLSEGDTFTLKNADNQTFKVKIAAIVENYVGHFAYLTPKTFEEVFDKQPTYNTDLVVFKGEQTKKQEKQVAEKLMEQEDIINVSFLSDSSTALDETTGTLNIVVWVLIISAGLLAFIVLYNLNNINISERIRELSTIKVLGFYDKEVTMYIYRENIFLTFFGVLVGLAMGILLHGYVLQTVEMDMLMFSPMIHSISYIYASCITIFFTLVVGIVMYLKLKKVDMIEALKSNE